MADGFSAIPSVLSAGSRQLRELRNDVDRAGAQATNALIGAADACGNGQVQAALGSLAKTTMQRFMDAMAGCEATCDRLAKTAQNYEDADDEVRQRITALLPQARPQLGTYGFGASG
jgi:hypothetical protein